MAEFAYNYDYSSPAVRRPEVGAPQRDPRKEREFKKYSNPMAERMAGERAATKKALKVASFLMAALVMFSITANSFYQKDSSKRELQEAKSFLVLCESENKELSAKLNALASAENIEKYAVETLGMVKVTGDKEVYLKSETGNKTLYRQGQ